MDWCGWYGCAGGGGKEKKEKEKKKKKKEDDQIVLSAKFLLRGAKRIFSKRNGNKKRTKAPQTPRKHTKRLFDFAFFYWLVWFFCIGWVGFGLKTLTANTQSSLRGPVFDSIVCVDSEYNARHFDTRFIG